MFIPFPLCLISLDIQNSHVSLPHRPNPRQISSNWLQLEPHQPSSSPTKLGIGPRPFYNKHGHRVHPAAVTSSLTMELMDFWWFFAEDFFVEVRRLTKEQWKFESKGHDMRGNIPSSTLASTLRWNWSRVKMRWNSFCYKVLGGFFGE